MVDLFTNADFDGETYEPERDQMRLSGQLKAVFDVMSDGKWRTLPGLAMYVTAQTGRNASEASVSARLRDLRKDRFGAHDVERRYIANGMFQYRLLLNKGDDTNERMAGTSGVDREINEALG